MPARAWLGCYRLVRGDWDSLPEPILQDLPGPSMQLTSRPYRHSLRFYAGPALPAGQPVFVARLAGQQGAWWLGSDDSVMMSIGGLAGVGLHLSRREATIAGAAISFTDILQCTGERDCHPWVTHAVLSAEPQPCEPAA